MDVEEMKSTVLQYSTIKNELKHLQNQTKILRNKRNVLSEKMKTFMRYNQLELCHISEKVPTDIRKIRYVQRDKKSRVTLKMIETHFEQFICNTDIQNSYNSRTNRNLKLSLNTSKANVRKQHSIVSLLNNAPLPQQHHDDLFTVSGNMAPLHDEQEQR